MLPSEDASPSMILAHCGDNYKTRQGAVSPPVYLASLFACETLGDYLYGKPGMHIYSRYSNPNVSELEEKVAALEHGRYCLAYANGMAAASAAITAVVKPGDHVVCVTTAYGCISEIFENYFTPVTGVEISYARGDDTEALLGAVHENTSMIILESPGSNTMMLTDLMAVTEFARARHITTYIDNTYSTPVLQNPLELGVDIVMHTSTKYLNGHSDSMGGLLVLNDEALYSRLNTLRHLFGGIQSPMDAWLTIRGLRTLEVRLKEHGKIAQTVAEALEKDPHVVRVFYPGLESFAQKELYRKQMKGCSGLLSFELNCDTEKAVEVLNALKIFTLGPSWGGYESLAVMPLYAHSDEFAASQGSCRGLIRISCGLEGADALLTDLRQAFTLLD